LLWSPDDASRKIGAELMTRGTRAAATPTAAWHNRITGSGEEAPDQLLANPANWRIHPKAQQDALAGALDQVGWVQQVLVNQRSGFVVDGHARVALAMTRGETTVPVLYVDLDPAEEALVLATLDPISAMATSDDLKLRELLTDVTVDDAGLAALLARLAPADLKVGLTDPDDAPPLGETSHIRPGDLFALGDHRLMCGDATDAVSYASLLGTQRVGMVWTDPPWNVAIGQDSNPRHRQRAGLANDDLAPAAFRALLDAFAANVTERLDGDLYCVLGASEWPTLDLTLREAGLHWSATIIWAKDLFVLGRSNYHRRYEPVWYGWPSGRPSTFNGARNPDDVWEIPRPRRSEEHPTMKPVELVERAIRNSSTEGATVLDPFAGSGTTLIAAEQTGRRCYAMEIDPRYVAVAIERWEKFTGRQAERVDG
jgi:DNA modification methylase